MINLRMRAGQGLITVLLLAVMLAAGLLAAVPEENRETEDSEASRELLLWSYYETQAQTRALDKLMADFNASQDKYELSWEYVPMTEFDRRISRAYTESELPDMVMIDNPDMLRFIQLGMFEDITDYALSLKLDEEYYRVSAQTTKYKGDYYGVPFNSNNVCLIINKDIFEAEGISIPTNWEELYSAAHRASEGGYHGFLMSCIDSEQGAFQILSWVMSATDTPERIDRNGVKSAFGFLKSLIDAGYMPVECINYSQTDVARRFIMGDIAMMENGPWVFAMLDDAGIDYDLAPLPSKVRPAVICGGENLGIIKGKNVEGSIAFIRYCMEEGGIEDFCRSSVLLPSRKDLAKRRIKEDERLAIIDAQMDSAIARTSIDGWNGISDRLTKCFSAMVAGELDLESAASEVLN